MNTTIISGFGKLITIWYKRHIFRQLVMELADIWPVELSDKEAAAIKRHSLSALKQRQICKFLDYYWFSDYLLFIFHSRNYYQRDNDA